MISPVKKICLHTINYSYFRYFMTSCLIDNLAIANLPILHSLFSLRLSGGVATLDPFW